MKKLASVFIGVSLLFCVFSQQVAALIGVSGFLVAALFLTVGLGFALRGMIGGKSHSFDQRTTEGGFLS